MAERSWFENEYIERCKELAIIRQERDALAAEVDALNALDNDRELRTAEAWECYKAALAERDVAVGLLWDATIGLQIGETSYGWELADKINTFLKRVEGE